MLDANVLISSLLSPAGAPARAVLAWIDGSYELIVSRQLLAELRRALSYPKLRRRVTATEAEDFVSWLERSATVCDDPRTAPPEHAPDPADGYLLALAVSQDALLVSGDRHLLTLRSRLPVVDPGGFLEKLEES